MINPLLDLPLNTNQVYVMAETKSGCEIYMPVASRFDAVINIKKQQLETFLASQPDPKPIFDEPELL